MKIQNMPKLDTVHAYWNLLNFANGVKRCFSESLPTKIFFNTLVKPFPVYKVGRNFLARFAVHTVPKAEVDYLTRRVSTLVLSRCLLQWRVVGKNLKKWVPPLYYFFSILNQLFYMFLEKVGMDELIYKFVGKNVEKGVGALLRPLVDKMIRIVRREIASRMIDKGVSVALDYCLMEAVFQKGVSYLNDSYLEDKGYSFSPAQVFWTTSGVYGANCARKFLKSRRQLITREQMREFLVSSLERQQKEFYKEIQSKLTSFGFNATDSQINGIVGIAQNVIVDTLLFFFDVPDLSES